MTNGSESYHSIRSGNTYVRVILPLALPRAYTYYVPEELQSQVRFGVRVEVQFGKSKYYAALVVEVLQNMADGHKLKAISAVLDEEALITPIQVKMWEWMAGYYCCTLGEIMHAALPANLKLSSETILTLNPLFNEDFTDLDDQAYLIAEALTIQNEITISDVQKILNRKTVYPIIKTLIDTQVIYLKEELKHKYQPKKVACLQLQEPYRSEPGTLTRAFDLVSRSERQTQALMAYIQLDKKQEFVRRQDVYKLVDVDSSVLKALEKKGIMAFYDRKVSRLGNYEEETVEALELSGQQAAALEQINAHFAAKQVVLLHGVTGSGKTRVYIELIQKVIADGGQVLYLLPEIALTTQIISRLQKIFGDDVAVYHSRLNNQERVEIWQSVLQGKPVTLGARSALFMPFQQLDLIIVDEEHDPSYKQNDPSPRYQGRDTAIYLALLHKAKVLLGTATPSIESYYNAKMGKYGLVEMQERFGGIQLPEIVVADAKTELQQRKLQAHFTTTLIDELKAALGRGEQAILFQNRRGFAPYYQCQTCAWHSECIHCDVSLTYHKLHHNLKCHYCGYQTKLPVSCPACGSKELMIKGFGTEKIEDDIKIYLPDAKVGRMDLDTARSKQSFARIINDFEEGRVDILVGTQMVTKGLDFENVGVVGVLSADQLLQFPDFRAAERAFQLMTQVSGRAGRKHKRGRVIIQAFNPAHPVIANVVRTDFMSLYLREIQERQAFSYPPYFRLIHITLKHRKPKVLNEGAKLYALQLKEKLGERVLGPAVPYISRIRGYYLLTILIKLEKDRKLIHFTKQVIQEAAADVKKKEGLSGVRINIDVDPY